MDNKEVVAQLEKDVGKIVDISVEYTNAVIRDRMLVAGNSTRDEDSFSFIFSHYENAWGGDRYCGVLARIDNISIEDNDSYHIDDSKHGRPITFDGHPLKGITEEQMKLWEKRNG